ncbi:hypothetical protein [Homoserinimonas hongtaonis]|nr:hypothetical protein [Salinibacterium hongtaonis]
MQLITERERIDFLARTEPGKTPLELEELRASVWPDRMIDEAITLGW